jgi:hypothetical protein
MTLQPEEIAAVEPGARAVLRRDRPGWRISAKLALMPLPPKTPERNPVRSLRQFTRDNWLSTASSSPTATSSTTPAPPGGASSTSHRAS